MSGLVVWLVCMCVLSGRNSGLLHYVIAWTWVDHLKTHNTIAAVETCTKIRIDFHAFVPSDSMLGLNGLRFEFQFGFGHSGLDNGS